MKKSRFRTIWIAHRLMTPNLGDRLIGKGMATAIRSMEFHVRQVEYTGNRAGYLVRIITRVLESIGMYQLAAFVSVGSYIPSLIWSRPECLIIGGGQLLLPNRRFLSSLNAWTFLAKAYRIQIYVLAVGTEARGEDFPERARNQIKKALMRCDGVMLRDHHSQQVLIEQCGLQYPLIPDAAYGLVGPQLGAGTRIGVFLCPASMQSVIPYGRFTEIQIYLDAFMEALESTIYRDETVRIFTTTKSDYQIALDLMQFIKRDRSDLNVDIIDLESEDELITLLENARVVIGARMHAVIAGHISGAEVKYISRNEKMEAVLSEVLQKKPEDIKKEILNRLKSIL